MYEVLALSMQIVGRPAEEVDRVVLSLADFGTANFPTLMFSAAYLVRLGRDQAGLNLYREASRMQPEQPEPFLLGLRLARKLQAADALSWAACGVLQYAWGKDHSAQHREAENAAVEAVARLRKAGDQERALAFEQALREARRRDIRVRLDWSGTGDLDLLVEEPGLSVCSFAQRETPGGGILLHEGYGPDAANCYEEYVCPLARSGEYRLTVRRSGGDVVGRRATLTIIQHQGAANEQTQSQTLTIAGDDIVVRFNLAGGRRTADRPVSVDASTTQLPSKAAARRLIPPQGIQPAALEYEQSRSRMAGLDVRRTGAVGFQPIIQIVPDGATFSAQAVVSPDRRYVRIGVSPVFTNLTDVFTFTFAGPGAGTTTRSGGPGN